MDERPLDQASMDELDNRTHTSMDQRSTTHVNMLEADEPVCSVAAENADVSAVHL